MRKARIKEIAIISQNPTTSLNPVPKMGEQITGAIQLHQGLAKRTAKDCVIEVEEWHSVRCFYARS